MTLIVLFSGTSPSPQTSMVHHCFLCVLLLHTCTHTYTIITRSYWHAQFYCSLSTHFILARRKNFITLYHDFIVSVLQLHSFVLFFLTCFILRVYVFRFVSLCFVLFCNVGFCFVFLLYVPEQCSLVVVFFSFSIYLISRVLFFFTKFCSLRIYSQKSFLVSLFC